MTEEKAKSPKEVLRDMVVDLVIDFVNKQGGMSNDDLYELFALGSDGSVPSGLSMIPMTFSASKE